MARVRSSFEIDGPPALAQQRFERDILPSIYKGSPFRLARERPGELVFSDGAGDFNRVFAARRVVEGEAPALRRSAQGPEPPPEPPRPRLMGILAPNVEHRQPWLYASLRRASSREITVSFEDSGQGATCVTIAGRADRRLAGALARLGSPGHWPHAGAAAVAEGGA